jgi:hypothetical protein
MIEANMSILTRDAWVQFQTEGKRSFLLRRIKRGLVIGLAVGLWEAFILAVVGTRRASLLIETLSIIIGSISVMALLFFLFYSILWELLRRKFSQY